MYKDKATQLEAQKRYRESAHGKKVISQHTQTRAYKDMRKEYEQDWRKKNPEKVKSISQKAHHKYEYGEPYEEKLKRIEQQGRRCANPGCRTSDPGPQGWHTDHDHETDEIRGELCHGCNLAIGLLKDSQECAEGLAIYLGWHK